PHQRGLAGAVRTDERRHHAGRNGHRDVVERPKARIIEDEMLDDDHAALPAPRIQSDLMLRHAQHEVGTPGSYGPRPRASSGRGPCLQSESDQIPPMHMYLISRKSSMPYFEPSRPMPDSLTPPN